MASSTEKITQNTPEYAGSSNIEDVTQTSEKTTEEASYSSTWFGFVGSVYETVKTTIAPKAYEFMRTQVAPRALHVMKRVLQDVPGGSVYPDSDDEWHECKLEESEEDEDEDDKREESFQDADEQLKPRDRIHNICHELMTTEQAYVNKLGILVMVKQKTTKLINAEVAKNMFKDIEVIHQFHKDYLLPQLQERLQYWEKYKCIGDIMRKLTPFLKLYTEYVKNFQTASTLVETWEDKSSGFKQLLKEIREEKVYGRLRIQAHMLEPVQRVPRYELLLSDYLKRLPEESSDREDTARALEQVSEAAKHFEDMMKRDAKILELVQLQGSLDGAVNIVSSSRELIRKGRVMTISAKSNKSVDRTAFLFNDLLLIADQNSSRLSAKLKVKHAIDITSAQIADGNNIDVPHTFYVKTRDTVVEICLGNAEEKEEWQQAIQKQMGACTKVKLLRKGSKRLRDTSSSNRSLGKRAPVLVHQSDVTMCMVCGTAFSALKKKKHCRACGNVVCSKCSGHSHLLEYDESRPLRVCDECFVILEDKMPSSSSPRVVRKQKIEGQCLEKGYLQLSSDGGKTWKRRWFAIHENMSVYSFKAPQDIHPMTSMSLNGYKFSLEDCPLKKGICIKLQGMGKIYYLHDEDETVIEKWFETLEELVQSPASPTASNTTDTSSIDSFDIGLIRQRDSSDLDDTKSHDSSEIDSLKDNSSLASFEGTQES